MPGFLHIMRCVGRAVVKNGFDALVNLVPFGNALFGIARDALGEYRKGDGALKAELQELAQADAAEVQQAAEEVAHEVAPNQPEIQPALVSYLTQIPGRTRQASRRPDDPSGKTVPSGLSLKIAEDLIPFLPPGPPRFKGGDRPPGVGDWELVKLLGAGGFGQVWLAHNPHAPSYQAALKFCLDPAAQQLLKYEATIIARVAGQLKEVLSRKDQQQLGIVPLLHTYLSADPPCLEYEFIEGDDLAGTIHRFQAAKGPLTPDMATKIVLQLARTIGQVHRLLPPVVHRDLKPANILVRRTKEGKSEFLITDFGIGSVAASQALEQTASASLPTCVGGA